METRLLVPGTGASIFKRPDGIRVASLWDLVQRRQYEFLCEHTPGKLDPDSTARTASGRRFKIQPAGILRGGYSPFVESAAPHDYRIWSYDWRLDIRYNGEELADCLDDFNHRWDVVCHSQGGLVLLWAAHVLGDRFPRFVRKVVFGGVPIFGNVNAALVTGADFFELARAVPSTIRTWPVVYRMLPRWEPGFGTCVNGDMMRDQFWADANLLSTDGDLEKGVGG